MCFGRILAKFNCGMQLPNISQENDVTAHLHRRRSLMLGLRVLSSAIILPPVIAAIWYGGVFYSVLLAFFGAGMLLELSGLYRFRRAWIKICPRGSRSGSASCIRTFRGRSLWAYYCLPCGGFLISFRAARSSRDPLNLRHCSALGLRRLTVSPLYSGERRSQPSIFSGCGHRRHGYRRILHRENYRRPKTRASD